MRDKHLPLAVTWIGCMLRPVYPIGVALALVMSAAAAAQPGDPSAPGSAMASGAAESSTVMTVTKPASPRQTRAWAAYLSGIVRQHSQGITATRSTIYFIPAGADTDAASARERQLANVEEALSGRLRPGNLIAFGGPDSRESADFVASAFQHAPPGACQGSVILFMGSPSDQAKVAAATQASGATLRFADTSGPTYLLSSASAQAPTPMFIVPPASVPPVPPMPAGSPTQPASMHGR
ncbi:MAG TPA: hypothetical protein VME63_06185 [Dyella sp.]|uniref:hypothetical protein n=1 Tax=Dyella sp. TaxID=1869338 RepID=UPI002BCEE263|nr:hypothetical protein [Dyella sp.]HTV84972.1 hypothetical protein [Dyella sp.]